MSAASHSRERKYSQTTAGNASYTKEKSREGERCPKNHKSLQEETCQRRVIFLCAFSFMKLSKNSKTFQVKII